MDESSLQTFTSLKPVFFDEPKILILVSMPSVDSHLADFYYADEDNRFWPLMGALYQMPVSTDQERLDLLKANHLALWSVVKSCKRHLSEEDTMQDIQLNDIDTFLTEHPSIERILCVSRRTEHLLEEALYEPSLPVYYVPSPSAADLWYDSVEKLEPEWRSALGIDQNGIDAEYIEAPEV